MKFNKIILVLIILIIIVVFRNWILQKEIIGGDFPYYFQEFVDGSSALPSSWSGLYGNGMGGKILLYGLESYMNATHYISNALNVQWSLVYKVFWFGLFLGFSFFSSFKLSSYILSKKSTLPFISSLIYCTNTYVLMIVGGGQMGYAIAYSFFPLLVWQYLKIKDQARENYIDLALYSIVLSFVLAIDIRIFYIYTFFTVIFFILELNNFDFKIFKKLTILFFIPNLISLILNSFWILPLLLNPINPNVELGSFYASVSSLSFFSFATLSNTISFLHPNWPENIFGKVAFQNPIFLILPLIVFASIILGKPKRRIIVFNLISLVGIFLAKGVNEPLGGIYRTLFEMIPGFQMFRDPTKWYLLIAVSYSVLIPITIFNLSKVKTKFKRVNKYSEIIYSAVFICVWAVLIKEAIWGNLTGTFSQNKVPSEYVAFKNKLTYENQFSRVMWVPRIYKFSFSNNLHPPIESQFLFSATNSAETFMNFEKEGSRIFLERRAVKYIVIPYDSMGVMFLNDRKYDEKERLKFEKSLDKISYLTKINDGNLTVYKTPFKIVLFSINGRQVNYKSLNPTLYELSLKGEEKGNILFSQNYHKNWRLISNGKEFMPQKTYDNLMEFQIPENIEDIKIEFIEQTNYNIGWIISGLSFALLVIYLAYPPISRKL